MVLLMYLVFIVLIFWAFERFYLRGNHHDDYATPTAPDRVSRFTHPQGPEQEAVIETVRDLSEKITHAIHKHQLRTARAITDSISDGRDYVSKFIPADAAGVPAEWVIAPGSDYSRRMLFIHGGGFITGSPKSHRTMTSKFSEITGGAVLAIDYRLMPEHKYMDGVEDCRISYQWLLENGPDGPAALRQLYLAGDSAGGNLALSLVAWVRDNGLRAPEAVVAMSPLTDGTFSGASMRNNEATDVMLAPLMRVLNRLPQFMKSWWVVWTYRIRPANPVISPLFGDLSDLPATLVQASYAEMLLDDARRYVCKARASGSPIKLQIWSDMVHVWQIFDPELPQAAEAWAEIGRFLEARTPA